MRALVLCALPACLAWAGGLLPARPPAGPRLLRSLPRIQPVFRGRPVMRSDAAGDELDLPDPEDVDEVRSALERLVGGDGDAARSSVGAGAGAERVDLASLYAHPAKELPEVPEVPEGVELPEGAPEVPEALEALVRAVAPGSMVDRALNEAQEELEEDLAALASGARGSLATAYALLKSLRRRVNRAMDQASQPATGLGEPSAIADSEDELALLAAEAAKVADRATEAGRLAQAAAAAEPDSDAREELLEQAHAASEAMSEAARQHGLLRAAFQTLEALKDGDDGLTADSLTAPPLKLPQAEAVVKDGKLSFTVPEDAVPGEMIALQTPQGRQALTQLSEDTKPGDKIELPFPSELSLLDADDEASLEQVVVKADLGLRLAGLPAHTRAAAEEALRAAGLRTAPVSDDAEAHEALLSGLAGALRDAGTAEDVISTDIAALREKLRAPGGAEAGPSTPTEALSATTLTAAEAARVRSVLEEVEDAVRNAGLLDKNFPRAFREALRDSGVESDLSRVEKFVESFKDVGLDIDDEAQKEIRETLEGAGVQLEEPVLAAVGKALLVDLAFGPGIRAGNAAAQMVAKSLPPGKAIRIVSKVDDED